MKNDYKTELTKVFGGTPSWVAEERTDLEAELLHLPVDDPRWGEFAHRAAWQRALERSNSRPLSSDTESLDKALGIGGDSSHTPASPATFEKMTSKQFQHIDLDHKPLATNPE